jgi:hypothetical protein
MLTISVLLGICILPVHAAEKQRDWRTGVILESREEQSTLAWGSILNQRTALVNRRVYAIGSAGKEYLVTGFSGRGKQVLTAGMNVRLAVEANTMYLLLGTREYRLYILQENLVPLPTTPPRPESTPATSSSDTSDSQSVGALDNDAVVKMVVGGLKEETIIQVIEARLGKYVLDADALQALKAAGVSPHVLAAMSAKMNSPR